MLHQQGKSASAVQCPFPSKIQPAPAIVVCSALMRHTPHTALSLFLWWAVRNPTTHGHNCLRCLRTQGQLLQHTQTHVLASKTAVIDFATPCFNSTRAAHCWRPSCRAAPHSKKHQHTKGSAQQPRIWPACAAVGCCRQSPFALVRTAAYHKHTPSKALDSATCTTPRCNHTHPHTNTWLPTGQRRVHRQVQCRTHGLVMAALDTS